MTVARSPSGGVTIRDELPVLWMKCAYNRMAKNIDDAKRHIGLLKMTQRGFDSATYTRTDPPWGSTVWCLWLPCYCSGRQTRLADWLMELWSAVHCRTKRRRRHKPLSYRYSAHFGSQQDLASLLPSSSLSLDPWTSSTLHRTAASPTVLNRLRNTQTPIYLSNGPITIAIRARFEYDSSTIQLQHATTCYDYEVFRALTYEIVYENQW